MAPAEHDTSQPTDTAVEIPTTQPRRSFRIHHIGKAVGPTLIVTLCLLHSLAIWTGLGGMTGLTNGWPLWRDDHPLYFHSALVTRDFLRDSYTTAGYDASFMSGYAKSVVFPASSTVPELVVALFGGTHPEFAYKVYVLISAAAVPWLIALACVLWHVRHASTVTAVSSGPYVSLDGFPHKLCYLRNAPLLPGNPRWIGRNRELHALLEAWGMGQLVAGRQPDEPGCPRPPDDRDGHRACGPACLSRRMHETGIDCARGPAGVWTRGDRLGAGFPRALEPGLRHLGVWLIPACVLALNAFWWVPGIWLSSTKGPSDFAFHHPEGVLGRLAQIIVGPEAPIQSILLALGLPGLAWMVRRQRIEGVALLGFCAAGLFWGYLAGFLRRLDFLQPGRHTYALYTGLAIAGALGLEELARRLRMTARSRDQFHRWVMLGVVVIAVRMVGTPMFDAIRSLRSAGEPFLSSRPSPRLLWVLKHVRRHVQPGERLLYEEGGKDLPGIPDPFHHGRFSGLLPQRTSIELLGGPYLHASLTTNFTQFGEGKLFGRPGWYQVLCEDLSKIDLALAEKVFGWEDRLPTGTAPRQTHRDWRLPCSPDGRGWTGSWTSCGGSTRQWRRRFSAGAGGTAISSCDMPGSIARRRSCAGVRTHAGSAGITPI